MRTTRRRSHARKKLSLFERRWVQRSLGVLIVWTTLLGCWSLVVSSRPGNESFTAKAADWARENHFGGIVNWAEERYYTWKAPPKGGVPARLITIATSTTTTTTLPQATTTTTLPVRPHSPPPVDVTPLASPPVDNEGVWTPIGPLIDGFPSILAAQLRPDAEHTSVLGSLVWIDPKLVRLQVIPGTVEPGGKWSTAGRVPSGELPYLIGAFNGGFRFQDAEGGFFTEGREQHPLVPGAASIVVRVDGSMDIGAWGRDDVMGADIATVRQNLALIVDGAQPVDGLDANDTKRWGRTLGNKVLVWRSGVGVRADGTVVYAASNGLSVLSLARLLAQGGCVRAMELDINPEWVTYNIFKHADPANPAAVSGSLLLPDMQRPRDRYLQEESRDFVALYQR
ncbi:MAG: phosphodiester glycosidase family protein [Acidimicrobiales bacterium]